MNMVETERLILIPFSVSDTKEYFQIVNDPDIRKYVRFASKESIDELAELIECYSNGNFRDDFYFEIREKDTSRIIGSIIAIRPTPTTLDVSYLIGSKYRGNGYMTEALLGFIRYIYNDVSVIYHSLKLVIKKENIASERVVQKCGGQVFRSLANDNLWIIKLNPFDLL